MSLQKLNKSPKGGHFYRKQFQVGNKRSTIRLGRLTAKNAETVSRHIDELVESIRFNTPVPAATTQWLMNADRALVEKLAKNGLCEPMIDPTISEFCERFMITRNVKERTKTQYGYARQHLVDYFGEAKRIKTVTAADADDFYQWMLAKKYSVNTVGRRVGRVREIFNEAIEQGILLRNPFKKRTIKVSVGAAKKQEVSEATVQQVIEHCPTVEWKLLFAFARWVGCRIPSEIENLTWDRIDWERNTILIPSPKTAHRGRSERLVPIFPEVYGLLDQQSYLVGDSPYVFPVLREHSNLSTTAKKWVGKAKLPVWPSFFNTLRANRETDLMDSHGIRKACAWIGNTPAIAMKNYATQKGSDFDDSQRVEKVTTKVTKNPRERDGTAEKPFRRNPIKQGMRENRSAWHTPLDSRGGTRTRTSFTDTGF